MSTGEISSVSQEGAATGSLSVESKMKLIMEPLDFVVVRQPSLPRSTYTTLLSSDQKLTVAENWQLTCQALHKLYSRTELIEEAIRLASPSLTKALTSWTIVTSITSNKASNKNAVALAKYINRMCTRCTPFGLFAITRSIPVSVLSKMNAATLETALRNIRLDGALIYQIGRLLHTRQLQAGSCQFITNDTAYTTATDIRFIEPTDADTAKKVRAYALKSVRATDSVKFVMKLCNTARAINEIYSGVNEHFAAMPRRACEQFVDGLIELHLLVPERSDTVISGCDPMLNACYQEERLGKSNILHGLRNTLSRCQRGSIPLDDVSASVMSLGVDKEQIPSDILQVDVNYWDNRSSFSEECASRICSQVAEIFPFFEIPVARLIYDFTEKFKVRFGDKCIPLSEVMDDEVGLGFPASHRALQPLVDGLVPYKGTGDPQYDRPIDVYLRILLHDTLAAGRGTAVIEKSALKDPEGQLTRNAPVSACLMGSLYTPHGPTGTGSFMFELQYIAGASAATLLGRFGNGNETLRQKLYDIAKLDSVKPDVIYADIVHLPYPRAANVVSTPDIRSFDICFLGQSCKAEQFVIRLSDLYLMVVENRLVLVSKRLGRQVMPVISNMHNAYSPYALPVYQFLTAYSRANYSGSKCAWDRIGLRNTYRPRLIYKNLILSAALWALSRIEIESFCKGQNLDEGYKALSELRVRRNIPRFIQCGPADNTLTFDLDNKSSFYLFRNFAAKRGSLLIFEDLHHSGNSLHDDEGKVYSNEVIIPFKTNNQGGGAFYKSYVDKKYIKQRFHDNSSAVMPPGSEWLYVKIYCGSHSVRQILNECVSPVMSDALSTGAIRKWFFIIFSDTQFHLRIRILASEGQCNALWRLYKHMYDRLKLNGYLDYGCSIVIDTYQREVERYGGSASLSICEDIFMHDSLFCIHVSNIFERHRAWEHIADLWWLAGLLSLHNFCKLWFGDNGQINYVSKMLASYRKERVDVQSNRHLIGARYRAFMELVDSLLWSPSNGVMRELHSACAFRDRNVGASAKKITGLISDATRLNTIISSCCHMSLDRLIGDGLRDTELMLYEFLMREYSRRLALGLPIR